MLSRETALLLQSGFLHQGGSIDDKGHGDSMTPLKLSSLETI